MHSDTTNRDHEAIFQNGKDSWHKYVSKYIYFPNQYKIVNADKAVVVVSFTVNEEGKVEDVFASTRFYPEFDKLALRVITTSPAWNPEISHNRRIKSYMRQQVTFSQE